MVVASTRGDACVVVDVLARPRFRCASVCCSVWGQSAETLEDVQYLKPAQSQGALQLPDIRDEPPRSPSPCVLFHDLSCSSRILPNSSNTLASLRPQLLAARSLKPPCMLPLFVAHCKGTDKRHVSKATWRARSSNDVHRGALALEGTSPQGTMLCRGVLKREARETAFATVYRRIVKFARSPPLRSK